MIRGLSGGAAVFLGPAALGGVLLATACGGQSDEARIEELLNQQLDSYRDGDWREVYKYMSPTFQRYCPYDVILEKAEEEDWQSVFGGIEYEDIEVKVDGDEAVVTWFATYEGEDFAAATASSPDLFVKIDGEWYDEYDEWTNCE